MNFEPDHSKIEDECLFIHSLSDILFTKRQATKSFNQFQYLAKHMDERIETLLAEYLLSVCVKTRYLDDRTNIIGNNARKQIHVIDNISKSSDSLESLRWALNKIIHQTNIKFQSTERNAVILSGEKEEMSKNELSIPQGLQTDIVVMMQISGVYQKKPWSIELCLTQVINEIMRVIYMNRLKRIESLCK